MWSPIALKMDEELLEKIFDMYLVEVQAIKHVKDVIPAMVMQPINKDEMAIFKKNGGNCMGMEDADGPLIRALLLHIFSNTTLTDSCDSLPCVSTLVAGRRQRSDEQSWQENFG